METTAHDPRPDAASSDTAATMRAAVYRRFGPPDVVAIERVPRPEPGAGEVLVRVRAASVSIADHRVRARDVPRGLALPVTVALGFRKPKKPVLGMDAAGVVERVGAGITDFRPGDRVIVMRAADFGCHAEYVTVRADGAIARIPDEMSFVDATALPFGFGTARVFLAAAGLGTGGTARVDAPGTAAQDRIPGATAPDRVAVLVNGASGAVGSAAVQLARTAGARVVGVCSGANAELVTGLGADEVVDYKRVDVADGSRRCDVVVDCVGNLPHARARRVLRRGGVLLMVITDLPGMVGARLRRTRDGIRRVDEVAAISGADLTEIVRLAATGAVRPVIDAVFDLDDIREAHARVDTGRKRGNVIVTLPA